MDASIATQINLGGLRLNSLAVRSGDTNVNVEKDLPAGKLGTLTTRTDDNTGVVTLDSGHGIVTSDVVDVYWVGGCRRGMTATVSDNEVTVDGGTGGNLPAQSTAVIVSKQISLNVDFAGNDLELIATSATCRAAVGFYQEDDTPITARDIAAGEGTMWMNDGSANVFADVSCGKLRVSCGDAIGGTFRLAALLNTSS